MMSLWEAESFFSPHDFIIAGAGLTGLWCALELKQKYPAAKISIIEKEWIPTGASTRNAGFACFGSPTEMLYDAEVMGAEKMWETVAMRYKGIEKIRQHFADEEIGFEQCGGYECLQNEKYPVEQLEQKLPWLNEGMQKITGRNNAFQFANDKLALYGMQGFDALIENPWEGSLHSGKLVQALMQKVSALGVHIFTGVAIQKWKRTPEGIIIQTAKNRFVTQHLIVATNAFSNTFQEEKIITPARGQIIVTSPIAGLPLRGTFHFDEGFYYFRNVGDRVLLGGARNADFASEETLMMETTGKIQTELEHFLSKHILPERQYTIEYRWSGIMAFTPGKTPLVKHLEEKVVSVICCNGMGVALSPVIPQMVFTEIGLPV